VKVQKLSWKTIGKVGDGGLWLETEENMRKRKETIGADERSWETFCSENSGE
jgi:hypothetical protein